MEGVLWLILGLTLLTMGALTAGIFLGPRHRRTAWFGWLASILSVALGGSLAWLLWIFIHHGDETIIKGFVGFMLLLTLVAIPKRSEED